MEAILGLLTKSVTNLVDINVAFGYQTVLKYGEIMFVPKLLTSGKVPVYQLINDVYRISTLFNKQIPHVN